MLIISVITVQKVPNKIVNRTFRIILCVEGVKCQDEENMKIKL